MVLRKAEGSAQPSYVTRMLADMDTGSEDETQDRALYEDFVHSNARTMFSRKHPHSISEHYS